MIPTDSAPNPPLLPSWYRTVRLAGSQAIMIGHQLSDRYLMAVPWPGPDATDKRRYTRRRTWQDRADAQRAEADAIVAALKKGEYEKWAAARVRCYAARPDSEDAV